MPRIGVSFMGVLHVKQGLSSAPPIPAGIQSFQWNEIQQKALLNYLFQCFPFQWNCLFVYCVFVMNNKQSLFVASLPLTTTINTRNN